MTYHGHLKPRVSDEAATASLQRYTGQTIDGWFGPKTEAAQQLRFCGCPDILPAVPPGQYRRWNHQDITYWHDMSPPGFSPSEVQDVIFQSLAAWNDPTGLQMHTVDTKRAADVYTHMRHIDGRSGVLAWSMLPGINWPKEGNQCEQRDDSGENWSATSWLWLAVRIHELGHALGLDHSPRQEDIMYFAMNGTRMPSANDIRRMVVLYGPPGTDPPPPDPDPVPTELVVGETLTPGRYELVKRAQSIPFEF